MRNYRTLAATAAATALVAGGAIVTGGFWSAEGSTSSAAHHGWPVAASRTPAADLRAAVAAAKRDDARTLTLFEVDNPKHDVFVDVGASGQSPGDFFLFENKLYTPDRSRQVGRDSGHCVAGTLTFTCDATIQIFGKGKIVVSGALFTQKDNVIAITGGTGAYRTADGTLTVKDLNHGNSLLTLHVTS